MLTYQQRQIFFLTLARTFEAGIPLYRLEEMLEGDFPLDSIKTFSQRLQKGLSIAAAGEISDLLLEWEASMIKSAEQSGMLVEAFQSLANYYQQQSEFAASLWRNTSYTVFLLIAAAFISPVPSLVLGHITYIQYFSMNLFPVLIIFSLGKFYLKKLFYKNNIHYYLPWGKNLKNRDMLVRLELLLRAGVPADQALETSGEIYGQATAQMMSQAAAQGQAISQILHNFGVLEKKIGMPLVTTGEASGKLEEQLQHYIRFLNNKVIGQMTFFSTQLPRIIYILIAIAIGYSIFQGFQSATEARDLLIRDKL